MTKEQKSIYIKGARVHNLKNIEVEIPHNRLVVITGLSGSGKSTLAFDTIFAEGQRRYVESLSAYARQFLGKINKPDVDVITGIAPAIAIEQKVNTRNPRSTVGTTTELYDYLKLLYARIGHTFSPVSGQEVKCYTEDDVAQYILSLPEGSRVAVAAPLQLREGQGVIEKLTLVLGEGILRVHAAGETLPIEDFLPRVDGNTRAEDISIVVDRAKVSQDGDLPTRLRDSVARAFSYGNGVCRIVTPEGVKEFSARFEADGIEFEPPTEHLFSFNNPLGACPTCEGYGKIIGIDEDLVIPDKRKTIYEDAVACWRGETMRAWKDQLVANAYKFDFPIHTPFYQLTAEQKRLLWRGNEYFHGLNDFFAYIDSERRKIQFRVMKARYTGKTVCPECGGSGKVVADPCPDCGGSGRTRVTSEQTIEFPAGTHDGDEVRISGMGHAGTNGAAGGDLVGRAHVEAERLEGKARTGFYLMGIVAPFLVLSAISGVFSAFAVMCFIPFAMGLFMVLSDGVLHRSLLWWKRGAMQFANGFANGFMFALVSVWFASCSQRAMLSPYAMQ